MNIGEYQPNVYLRSPKGLLGLITKNKCLQLILVRLGFLKFDKNGNYLGPVQDYTQDKKVFMPQPIFVDSYNNLYVADHMSHRVLKYGVEGNALGEIGYSGQYSSVHAADSTSDNDLWKSLRKTPQTSYFWFEDSGDEFSSRDLC